MPEPGELQMVAPRRRKPPVHLSDLTLAQRRDVVKALDLPGFRADQVSKQWFGRLADDPATWTDVPEAMRASLSETLTPALLDEVRRMQADNGLTVKSLWRLFDGALVESVLMRYPATERSRARTTVCISSQAGCGMNCPFCATGQAGLTRNLSTGEIVEQVVAAARLLDRGEAEGGKGRVGNIVFMGMGEPLANYDAVIGAVRRLSTESPEGLGLSARNITVSTVGLVPRIQQLATEGIPVTLAVSLHAPDDELRDTLVPINTRFKVDEVLDATWNYAHVTRRRVSIEYALIRDVNDQAERADLLGKLLKGRLVHVNLIPLNPTPGSKWTASRRKDEAEFVRRLQAHGVAVTVRDTRGRDIDGACGQLAAAE